MGVFESKEYLYSAIDQENLETIKEIISVSILCLLQQDPNLLNRPMTDDCSTINVLNSGKTVPLARAAWRNSIKVAELLIEMGANLDLSGPTSITPLMWACIRGHEEMVMYLLKRGAKLEYESNNGFNALDFAILHNRYRLAFKLQSIKKFEQKEVEVYVETAAKLSMGKYDYSLFLSHLSENTDPSVAPTFLMKSETKVFVDPVIDPRETWSAFFKRILEFEDPPLIERDDLPVELQPQNRALGKVSMYLEDMSLHTDIKRQHVSEERKLTNLDISLDSSPRNIQIQRNSQDIEMMIEERKE